MSNASQKVIKLPFWKLPIMSFTFHQGGQRERPVGKKHRPTRRRYQQF